MYDQRAKTLPKLPQTTDDIQLDDTFSKTSYGDFFLLFDTKDGDRIICYASRTQLSCLSLSPYLHGDGTFSTSPLLYYQLYIISAWYLQEMHPCCFVFLKSKKQATYRKMLELICSHAAKLNLIVEPKVKLTLK